MAGGGFAPDGQKVKLTVEKKGLLKKNEEWDIAFGQQMSYVQQKEDISMKVFPKGLPDMKRAKLTLTGQLGEDVVLFIIEHPSRGIYQLAFGDKNQAAAMAQRFPQLAPILARYR
jgi:hypothetical protein